MQTQWTIEPSVRVKWSPAAPVAEFGWQRFTCMRFIAVAASVTSLVACGKMNFRSADTSRSSPATNVNSVQAAGQLNGDELNGIAAVFANLFFEIIKNFQGLGGDFDF